MIERVEFRYDVARYGTTLEQLRTTTRVVVPVVVQGQRIALTRARFDLPWSVVSIADVDPDLVDRAKLTPWLVLGGRHIGLGDWRLEKSGLFGRFVVESVTELPAAP